MLPTLHRLRPTITSKLILGHRSIHGSLRTSSALQLLSVSGGETGPSPATHTGELTTSTSTSELASFQDHLEPTVPSQKAKKTRTSRPSAAKEPRMTRAAKADSEPKEKVKKEKKEKVPKVKKVKVLKEKKVKVKTEKPSRPIIEPPKKNIEAFLEKIESEKDLTLEDVERYRPPRIPDQRSDTYEKEYNNVMNNLIRSFDAKQLHHISRLYELSLPPHQKKSVYAAAIIEKQWNWTPLSTVLQIIRDETELSDIKYPLTRDQAFLFMGKDGSQLLKTSKHYEVHFSLSGDPITLRVKGLHGAVKRFEGYFNSFKEDIDVKVTALPLNKTISPETSQSISRLSEAFLEVEGDKLRIFYHRNFPRSAEIAERLAMQAASGVAISATQAIFLPESSSPGSTQPFPYSLYPFSPQQEISWTIPPAYNLFRLRRVGHWLEAISRNTVGVGGLAEGSGASVFLNSADRDLKAHLFSQIPASINPSQVEITATAGHFLLISSQQRSLRPPLHGQLNPDGIIQWISDESNRTIFNPSVPPFVLTCPTYQEEWIRRLTYVEDRSLSGSIGSQKSLIFEVLDNQPLPEGEEDSNTLSRHITCQLRAESGVNLLIPDRPVDIQLSAATVEEVPPTNWPYEIQDLTVSTQSGMANEQLIAPLVLTHDNAVYTLQSDANTQREHKKLFVDDVEKSIILETAREHESGQLTVVSKIVCGDYNAELGWINFLNQCDWLTSST